MNSLQERGRSFRISFVALSLRSARNRASSLLLYLPLQFVWYAPGNRSPAGTIGKLQSALSFYEIIYSAMDQKPEVACKWLIGLVGASGFEPPTSWSRTNQLNSITLYLGVAYGTRSVISPLLVVPNLYLQRRAARAQSACSVPNSELNVHAA